MLGQIKNAWAKSPALLFWHRPGITGMGPRYRKIKFREFLYFYMKSILDVIESVTKRR